MGSYADYKKRKALITQTAEASTSQEKTAYQQYKERKRAANSGVSVDDDYQALMADYKTFATAAQTDSANVGYGNARGYLEGRSAIAKDLRDRANKLAIYLHANQDSLDAEAYETAISNIESVEREIERVMDYFGDRTRYYSQWDTEDDYNAYVAEQKAYEDQLNFDTAAGEKEITRLERELKEYDFLTRWEQDEAGRQREAEYRAKYGDVSDLKALISEKQAYLNTAKRIQEGVRLAGVADPQSEYYDPEFSSKTGYVSTESDGLDKLFSKYGMGYDDLTYEYINGKQSGMREDILQKTVAWNAGGDSLGKTQALKIYDSMTEDEVSIYNYYYATGGKEAADKYLDSIQETLNYRSAQAQYGKLEGNTALELLFGVGAGFDQFNSGVKNLFNGKDYIAPSATQILSGMVRDDLKDTGPKLPDWMGGASLGQTGYDAITTTANMAPSILASIAVGTVSKAAGTYVGNALMGASAAGNAYREKLNMGYTKEQAGAYGTMIGLSEVCLEKVLGGITALGGGTLTKVVTKNLSKVDNVLSRFAQSVGGKVLMNAGSEALEEGLQTVLEPYLWQAVSGEEASVEWEEAFYSALMGAVTGGVFEGTGTAVDATQMAQQNRQAGKVVTANPGGVAALQQAAMDTASELDGSAQKSLERLAGRVSTETQTGKGLGSIAAKIRNAVNTQRVGKLYNRTANAITDLNVTELAARLEQGGFSEKKASAVARATMETVAGYELDASQQKLLESVWENPSYQQALTEIVKDEQSTVNQRRERIGQVLRDHSAEQETASVADPAAQKEHFPTFQEEVQRQFEEANGYADTEQEAYDIDEVFQAVQSALNDGTISEDKFDEIVNALSFAQSDYAEGNITEAEYNGALEAAMRQTGRFDGGNSESAYSASATDPFVNVDRETWQQAQRLAQALGRNIVFYNGMKGENGYFKDGTIYVNILAVDPFAQVVSHELTHSLEGTKHYEKLEEFVFTQLAKSGKDIAQVRDAKYKQYKDHGKVLESEGEIDAEIVAEYVQNHLLTNEQAIMDLVDVEPNIAKRIWNWVSNLARRMVGKQASRERAKLEQIAGIYAKALRESQGEGTSIGTVSVTNRAAGGETRVDELQRSRSQTEADYREGRISDAEYDAAMDEFDRAEDERLGRSLEKYSLGDNRNVEKKSNPRYNRKYSKVFFDENVFPPYNVSHSDSHEIAERWSRSENTQSGECRLISHNGVWYRIQAFDNLKYGYQIVKKIAAKDYDREAKLYGSITGYESLQDSLSQDVAQHYGHSPDGNAGYRSDYDGFEHGRKDKAVHRMGADEGRWTELESDGAGNRAGSRVDRTGEDGSAVTSDAEAGKAKFSFSSTPYNVDIGSLQVQLQQLKNRRRSMLESDATYAAAMDNLRYANTFTEKVAARKAMAAAVANIDTAAIDQRISDLNEQISEIRNRETRQHREDQEKYSGTKTAGYSTMPDTRLKDLDQDYMRAVRSGDRARIAELVEQAAEAAMPASVVRDKSGRLLKTYHHTGNRFTVFDRNMARTGTEMDGFFFAPDPDSTSEYGSNMITAYLNITKLAMDPKLDRKFNDSGTLLREKLAYQGYDGMARTENGEIYEYMAFDPEQIKSADPVVYDDKGNVIPLSERFNFKNNDIRYSFSDTQTEEQDRRPLEGSYTTDEVEMQARKKGYPVLHGEQVVPFRTWVQTLDRGNYGLVTGLAAENKLLVSFHNKHDGGTADNVAIPYGDLKPVPGAYQMTKEEFASLMASEPLDPGSENLSEEEMREIEELFNQAKGSEEKAAAPIDLEKLPRKAQNYLKRAQRKLLNSLCERLGVPRSAMREHLQGIVEEITSEYLNSGTVSDEKLGELFDKAYAQGIVTDREFYDQYKHIKDHLRTTAVTLSDQNKADIADYNDFRKRQFGRMRIVNQGGLPVDTAYDELRSMAPELFPEDIAHPADQLVHMAEVARSIEISKKTLDEYNGPERETFRSWAKNDFDVAVGEIMGDLHALRRFADEQAAKAARESAPATVEEAEEAYKKLKKARRVYERASAKNLLTQRDEMLVGQLLRHEMELEHLNPETDNVKGITAVYEAKVEYERLCKLIAEYKRHIHGELRSQADKYLATANNWKDKKTGIAYARETMRRNICDIVADRALAREINEVYFEPVHDAEASAVRMKDDYRNKVRGMDLSRKVAKGNLVSEAHAVQLLGEAEDNIRILENTRGRMQHRDGKTLAEWRAVVAKLWAENPNLDEGKIRGAVQQFRQIYDDLFSHMNRVRVKNGYEPINYRSGYFPHFQPGASDGILAQFGRALGIDTQVVALPTTITGLTHTFKPGIQWFGNAQERLGFNTAYDAVEGFDKYIEGAASVIFQTGNIQRLRAFATQVRYRTSDEGIKEQVDAVYEDNRLTDEEKQVKIADIYEHGRFALANFVAELDEYTNLLANKKSKYDRTIEALMGRKSYAFLKWWESRVGANMIAGNISSALTNFIPLTQAGAQMDKGALLKGMWKTLASYKTDDGLAGTSTFLTNRRGSDPLVQSWSQKASAKLGILMEGIDQFVSGSIVRGSYYHNLKRGMSEAEAMHQADIFASGVMADRSKGSMPTLMQASNPLFKMFTQFQLEVNNQFSEVFKDLPRNHREKGLLGLALVLFQYFIGAWAFNELYERLVGRRAALDPIGILLDAGKDFVDPDVGFGEGVKNLGSNVLSELPFSSGLTLIGFETDGGRIPASSAVPDLSAVWDAATKEGWSAERRWKELQDELNKLAYVVPPFGGNQVSKIWKGTKAFIEGGSYSVDAEGNDILQYPVYKDDPWSALGALFRATLLGKSSLPEAQEWLNSGFDGLNAKETAVYEDMLGVGVSQKDAFALMQELGAAQKTEELSKVAVQRDILRESDVPSEGKAIAYYGILATYDDEDPEKVTERVLMDKLAEMGADPWEVTKALMNIKDAGSLEGAEETKAKYDAIIQASLTDEEKSVLVGSITGTEMLTDKGNMTQYAKFKAAVESGMSVDEYLEFRKAEGDIDDYLDFAIAGLDSDDATDVSLALDELVPLDGKEQVSDVQKWRTCVDTFSNEATQLAALAAKMDDSQRAKLNIAYEYSVSPDTYVTLKETLPKFDLDGSGGLNQEEVTQAVNSIKGLTRTQRAVLWQISISGKSAKNNPYSVKVGQQVLDALNKG